MRRGRRARLRRGRAPHLVRVRIRVKGLGLGLGFRVRAEVKGDVLSNIGFRDKGLGLRV